MVVESYQKKQGQYNYCKVTQWTIVKGTSYSYVVECPLMLRWIFGLIPHGGPVLHNWCNSGLGMYIPVCGMVHIKNPLLLYGKCSP